MYSRVWIRQVTAVCVCLRVFSRYHSVQSALTQQSSELRDTRMLTEFLERVELEESQELDGSHYSLGQVRHICPNKKCHFEGNSPVCCVFPLLTKMICLRMLISLADQKRLFKRRWKVTL